jgi:hypothetical protein
VFPAKITVHNSAYLLDGGTTILQATDESEAYLRFAERVEQAVDPTRYTVWVAWEPASRNQVIVRLGRVLGIGLQAAREVLDSGTPLADGVTALEVSELTGSYSAEALTLRVEPPFRWGLT